MVISRDTMLSLHTHQTMGSKDDYKVYILRSQWIVNWMGVINTKSDVFMEFWSSQDWNKT